MSSRLSFDTLRSLLRSGGQWGTQAPVIPERILPLHIMLANCGYETRREAAYSFHGLGRGSHPFAIFQYTIDGEGVLEYEGTKHIIPPETGFLVHLPHDHRYYFDPAGKSGFWSHCFCTFNGREALRLEQLMESEHGPIFNLPKNSQAIKRLFRLIAKVRESGGMVSPFAASRLVYDFLMSLAAETLSHPVKDGERHPEILRKVNAFCLERMSDDISVSDMALAAGYSKFHFSRLFREETGTTPALFLRDLRLRAALRMLQFEIRNVKEISALCGFNDESYFCRLFRKKYGAAPGEFRNAKKN